MLLIYHIRNHNTKQFGLHKKLVCLCLLNTYSKWCLSDAPSGSLIQSGFKTLAEVKEFVANMDPEFKAKIDAINAIFFIET